MKELLAKFVHVYGFNKEGVPYPIARGVVCEIIFSHDRELSALVLSLDELTRVVTIGPKMLIKEM